ncbi:alanine racemase [Endozoicomonas sp. (ex Bugula neritina AB1)]|nr:alanine racemase [Endozoicomonas sp. (ex Bugula neritina AB1)]
MSRPARAIINLDALRHNYRLAKLLSGENKVIAVVKADAYSHGAVQCARALSDIADAFAVACIEEAVELRESGIKNPVLLLGGFFDESELPVIEKYQLEFVIHNAEQLKLLQQHPLSIPVRVWLKMDSGMGRIGFSPEKYHDAWQALDKLPFVNDIVLMSHFASADEADKRHSMKQLKTFNQFTLGLPGPRSMCNSAGLISITSARADWNRPGLLLYGVSPFLAPHTIESQLQPVMELHSAVVSIKDIAIGSSVGYGSNWVAERPTRLGIIAMGYADGYPRHAENGTPVLINGKKVPLVGRVSMDMLTVDLTGVPEIKRGDNAVLWGEGLPITEVARKAGTIPYQLLCNLSRVPVQYQSAEINLTLPARLGEGS